ncbi:MAG: hypothetical protein VX438_06940 [Planctomycetota bacterium]|nr:hypothetical protein [Planctomycetota bacterium]
MSNDQVLLPGISISKSKQATVSPELAETLFTLALNIEETTELPVDVQHVLAAVVMAAQTGEIAVDQVISVSDPPLVATIEKYVRVVFANYGGNVEADE